MLPPKGYLHMHCALEQMPSFWHGGLHVSRFARLDPMPVWATTICSLVSVGNCSDEAGTLVYAVVSASAAHTIGIVVLDPAISAKATF